MATIGRASAVAQTGNFRLQGFIAWVAWCFIHILYLIGFRNRVLVFFQWTWSYIRYRRGARLITNRGWKLAEPPDATTTFASLPEPSPALERGTQPTSAP
jgi:NADH dehydrogenase